MSPPSHVDPSDQIQDAISHDTCKTMPYTRSQERQSNEEIHGLQKMAPRWSAHAFPKQPPTTQVERNEVAGVLSAPNPSQRSKSGLENMDSSHAFVNNNVVSGEDELASDSSEFSFLSRVFESRLDLVGATIDRSSFDCGNNCIGGATTIFECATTTFERYISTGRSRSTRFNLWRRPSCEMFRERLRQDEVIHFGAIVRNTMDPKTAASC